MNFVRKIRGLRLGHDGNLDKLAVPLWPDAGKALGLSRNHTYDAARAGEIPTVRFGRTIRVPLAALRKMPRTPERSDRAKHGGQRYRKGRNGMKVGRPIPMQSIAIPRGDENR